MITANSNTYSVLVVDDEESIRKLLKSRFERENITVLTAENVDQALATIAANSNIAVVVTDVKMPGRTGLEMLKEITSHAKCPKVIMMTGHGEKSTAITALKDGATDYLEKPFDLEDMVHTMKRTLHEFRLERENEDFVQRLEARVARVEGKTEDKFWYVSKSKAMEPANEWLRVLQRESMRGTVEEPSTLIIGESGTGKEGIARMIHAGSRRAKGAWIAVNCANFSEQLLESELFGHEKGSFTGATNQKRGLFELAKGGTLFLDEIGEMDVKLQARLLRVVQEKNFRRVGGTSDIAADVRIVAATNQNLMQYVACGKFREDLYHRLARVVIELPALRLRSEDLVPMARQFFEQAFQNRAKTFEGFSPAAEAAIQAYTWPGNVRELLNVVERSALLWNGNGKVELKDLSLPSEASAPQTTLSTYEPSATFAGLKFDVSSAVVPQFNANAIENYTQIKKRFSDSFEKEYLLNILDRQQGNVTAAAKESGIDRSNFLRLLRRHHINAQEFRTSPAMKKAA
jgi:DNA-binding NtrC family response regulator